MFHVKHSAQRSQKNAAVVENIAEERRIDYICNEVERHEYKGDGDERKHNIHCKERPYEPYARADGAVEVPELGKLRRVGDGVGDERQYYAHRQKQYQERQYIEYDVVYGRVEVLAEGGKPFGSEGEALMLLTTAVSYGGGSLALAASSVAESS